MTYIEKLITGLSLVSLSACAANSQQLVNKSGSIPKPIAQECAKNGDYVTCKYTAFTTNVSCEKKAPEIVTFELGPDNGKLGDFGRAYKFEGSPELVGCQQTSTKSYKGTNKDFRSGHIAAIDHFDYDKKIAKETNVMTNILPQNAYLNGSGSWRITEKLTECYRDNPNYQRLTVYAGPIFGSNTENDHFKKSHGLPITPDAYWKLITYGDKDNLKYDAWITPNVKDTKYGNLGKERKSLSEIISTMEADSNHTYKKALSTLGKMKQHITQKVMNYTSHCKKPSVIG